jgi:hypothetical protein
VVMLARVFAGFEGCEAGCFAPGGTGRLQHDVIPSPGRRVAGMLDAWAAR